MKLYKLLNSVTTSLFIFVAACWSHLSFAATPIPFSKPVAIVAGQGLYQQQGANSCAYCHGMAGTGGNIAVAAKLAQPRTWKSWKALGGDAAFNKDRVSFLNNLEDAIVTLIQKGAISFNAA